MIKQPALSDPPYSLLQSNFLESWTESHMTGAAGQALVDPDRCARAAAVQAPGDAVRRSTTRTWAPSRSPTASATWHRHSMHEVPEFDFNRQQFNTPALLGDMSAATALTNIALGIAYANHMGKNVLVAGTTDPDAATAVLVVPPATVRPIEPGKPWYRARSEAMAYLMWWGMRDGKQPHMQGCSE